MFFGEDRILAVRQMILAGSAAARRTALAKILPMQRADFVEIFKAMTGLARDGAVAGSALARVLAAWSG